MKKASDILQEDKQLFALTKPTAKKSAKDKAKAPGQPRDYQNEEVAAQISLFDAMTDFRVQRRSGVSHELVQIAHALW